jgi:geranylgeranyl transferase type-2 subunit beta
VLCSRHSIASVLHLPTASYQVAWIDCDKLAGFILQAQDADEGGISDRPGNMPDIFHTFFGISGLLLLNYFGGSKSDGDSGNDMSKRFIAIDPTYALPVNVVQRLGLRSQVLHDVSIK